MKIIIFLLVFFTLATNINAQETQTTNTKNDSKLLVVKTTNDKTSIKNSITPVSDNSLEEDICYAEISKVAFYKALIRQNGFDIHIKDNEDVGFALRSTEEIITNNKERISYSK
ncbi:hypothetical protein [Aquimarina sp. 2304DJ70-9]|uniref:hypothetical protein n=1 Tax=Aquimarina penaris TaxID=3231044 RepID=UPI003462E487